jgi:hypothetical protein
MNFGPRRSLLVLLLLLGAFALLPLHAQFSGAAEPAGASSIRKDALLQPEQLHRLIEAHARLLILQVGSKVLFQQAHIPGSEYAGPGSRPEGLSALRARIQRLPRSQAIVLYCGCCPWDKCPNVGPAWNLLHSMGFTSVRVLYIATNFGADWVARGYHADSSH